MACKHYASIISLVASWIYFFIIFFQLPIFRVPCRFGTCQSPIEVTTSQLIGADHVFPTTVVKALLYPAAIEKALRRNSAIPSFDNSLKQKKFSNVKKFPVKSDIQYLEIIFGSYFSVAGAILGLLRSGRMSLFGMLLIIWGLLREAILRKSEWVNPVKDTQIYPSMSIAAFCAFLSVRKDVRKLIHSWRRVAKRQRLKVKYG